MLALMSSALPPNMASQTRPDASTAGRWKTKGLSLDDCTITKIGVSMAGKGGRLYDTSVYHVLRYICRFLEQTGFRSPSRHRVKNIPYKN